MDLDDLKISPDRTHHLFEGQPFYEHRFLRIGPFRFPGLAAVTGETGSCHIDFSGEPVYMERYAYAGDFSDGVALVKNFEGKYFHIDENGNQIGSETYCFATDFSGGTAVVCHEKYGASHITNAGELLYGDWYFDVRPFKDGKAAVRDETGWHFINKDGEILSDAEVSDNEDFPKGNVRFVPEKNPIPEILKKTVWDAAAVLIRHSERKPFIKGQPGGTKDLTPRGKKMAREFGERLSSIPIRMFTSPIFRCRQTAEEISAGSGNPGVPKTSPCLGDPGAYISDPLLTAGFYVENPVKVMSLRYISGEQLPGHYPIEEGTKRLLGFLCGTMRKGELAVSVTHDAYAAPFIANMTGYDFTDDWVGFLDGCILFRRGEVYTLWWRGKEYPVIKRVL